MVPFFLALHLNVLSLFFYYSSLSPSPPPPSLSLSLSLSPLKQTGKNNNHARTASNKSVYGNISFKATDKRTARLYTIREALSKAKEIGQARVILMVPNKEIQNLLQKKRYWLGESTRHKTF